MSPHHRTHQGFTLVELLVAMSLGALLLIATAETAGMFSESAEQIMEDVGTEQETALARMASDVRYAWYVSVPAAGQLDVVDFQGRTRGYRLDGTDLIAISPDGDEGLMCSGVAAFGCTPVTVQRLREGPVDESSGTLASVTPLSSDLKTFVLGDGGALAVAFRLASDAGVGDVPSVREQLLEAVVETITVPLAQGVGLGSVTVEIYPARAPDDPVPRAGAAALGGATVLLAALPVAVQKEPDHPDKVLDLLNDFYGVETEIYNAGLGLWIRLPVVTQSDLASAITNFSRLKVDSHFIAASADRAEETATFLPPATTAPIYATGRFANLQPGVAYTLVLTVSGGGSMAVLATPKVSGSESTVVVRDNASARWAAADYQVAFSLSGTRRVTSTLASDEAAVVRLELESTDGATLARSVGVYSQVMAADPWTGVVAGEPPLQP